MGFIFLVATIGIFVYAVFVIGAFGVMLIVEEYNPSERRARALRKYQKEVQARHSRGKR